MTLSSCALVVLSLRNANSIEEILTLDMESGPVNFPTGMNEWWLQDESRPLPGDQERVPVTFGLSQIMAYRPGGKIPGIGGNLITEPNQNHIHINLTTSPSPPRHMPERVRYR